MALFFECDRYIFESCDDSSGEVGDVFREDAATLFADYASDCLDKKWLGQLLVQLLRDDDYGVRDYLLESATDYLPTEELRNLIDRFLVLAEKETSTYRRRSWYSYVEQLADQLGDAQLFEKIRIKSLGDPDNAACLDIAGIYLKAGDPQTALAWIERIKEDSYFKEDMRNKLLQAIYSQLGDTDRLMEIAWKRFRGYRCLEGLDELLVVIGHGQREAVITEQVREILSDTKFRPSDAVFLVQTGQEIEAEIYLLQSVEQFNGDFYVTILPLAEAMEDAGRNLAATMLYRSLLDSILRRGYSKSYHHGARYLKKLDILSFKISDWLRFPPHEQYKRELRNAHGRKYSFWEKYDKE